MKPTNEEIIMQLIEAQESYLQRLKESNRIVASLIQKYKLRLDCMRVIESYNYTTN